MTTEQNGKDELLARLEVMETMMKEGRKLTDNHGWAFVLWGVAYLVAIGWTAMSGNGNVAWPVTMAAAGILSVVIGSSRGRYHPRTHCRFQTSPSSQWQPGTPRPTGQRPSRGCP